MRTYHPRTDHWEAGIWYTRNEKIAKEIGHKKFIYFSQEAINLPTEIFRCKISGKSIVQLTYTNKELVDQMEMNALEDFWFKSYDGKQVHGLLVKPPKCDSTKLVKIE